VLTNHVLRQPDGAPIALCAQAVSQMQEMRFAHCHLTTAKPVRLALMSSCRALTWRHKTAG
jgi:hypothetical protein